MGAALYVGFSLCPYLVLCTKRRRELRRCGESPERSFYHAESLREKTHYIASTGIEGRHADPSVLVQMDSYAVDGLEPGQVQFLYAHALESYL